MLRCLRGNQDLRLQGAGTVWRMLRPSLWWMWADRKPDGMCRRLCSLASCWSRFADPGSELGNGRFVEVSAPADPAVTRMGKANFHNLTATQRPPLLRGAGRRADG